VDGTIIPMAPQAAWDTGQFNKMPFMGGATRDEFTFFSAIRQYFSGWPLKPMTAADFAEAVKPGSFCQWCKEARMPAEAAAQYPLENHGGDPILAYNRLNTDSAKCIELHILTKWARQVPTYAYDFTYAGAPFYFPQMPGFKALATHTSDIQFLFRGFRGGHLGVNLDQSTGQPRELNAAETKLSDQLVAAWTRFADTGNPNGTGDQPWPRFTGGSSGQYLVQNIPLSTMPVSRFRAEYKCDFWDGK
jgi:para-nitrobenzyl esterase